MSTRSNGSIIGPEQTPTIVVSPGIWGLQTATQKIAGGEWPRDGLPASGLLALWDFSVASSLYDATSGGSLVTADGAIARVNDLSGNGNHLTQATLGKRPQRKTAYLNGIDAALFDGSTDGLALGSNPWGSTPIYIIIASSTSDTSYVMAHSLPTDAYMFVAVSGSGTSGLSNAVTSGSLRVDGAAFSGTTRGDVYTACNGTHVLTLAGVCTTWTNFRFFDYGSFEMAVTCGVIAVYDQSAGTSVRNAAESYLISKWGI
jgi:hypothetical protein